MSHITIIAGARPNFIKIAPLIDAILKNNSKLNYRLIHTGQHYDNKMSGAFFKQLNIPEPHVNLCCGGGTQAEQTSSIMIAFEKEMLNSKTDIVLVVGDVTSTMACSIVTKKLKLKLAHVEAGIRSNDLSMPEEINRLITDSITDYFFVTTKLAYRKLISEGHNENKIHFVGNVMIDTLLKNKNRFEKPKIWNKYNLKSKEYLVLTLHRPSNVDKIDKFKEIIKQIDINSNGKKVIFPVHPRVKKIFENENLIFKNIITTDPLGYLEFNFLVSKSLGVITDSGGITEETTVLGIPCITLRNNTERPETIEIGTNELIGTDPKVIKPALLKLFSGKWKTGQIPELWDGKSAERIIEIIMDLKGQF
jgi:UDP-N-acetylglucosamine 2-epimerase (non-hydrolysing)|tara:strand:+ start:3464 stop:4555 length:1092 start_codon:yes stop_codon:yes gene_type:complete